MERNDEIPKHFVLIHGSCHGAWQWFKLAPLLTKAGHKVTCIDLGASGCRPEKLTDLNGFSDYVKPLVEVMEGLPASERVILVAHSYGGLPAAWVSEMFPEKVSVVVFLAAFMPDTTHNPYYPVEQYLARLSPGHFVDSIMDFSHPQEQLVPTVLFGTYDLSSKPYLKSSPEDLHLGQSLLRVTSLFKKDLTNAPKFSEEKYGSVARVYIVCTQDLSVATSYQLLMVEKFPPKEVRQIDADHMPMLSAPQELLKHLLDIANSY